MTQQRRDAHSTEFGIWLRQEPDLDSRQFGFTATNIDFLWMNYRTKEWIFLEEKRYRMAMPFSQANAFYHIHTTINNIGSEYYKGFHFVQFEKTSPTDGTIFLNGTLINNRQLIDFLSFKSFYPSVFDQKDWRRYFVRSG